MECEIATPQNWEIRRRHTCIYVPKEKGGSCAKSGGDESRKTKVSSGRGRWLPFWAELPGFWTSDDATGLHYRVAAGARQPADAPLLEETTPASDTVAWLASRLLAGGAPTLVSGPNFQPALFVFSARFSLLHPQRLAQRPSTCRDWATKHRRGRTSPIPALVNRAASHVCSNLSSYRRGSTVRRVSSNPMISGIQYDPEWCPLVRG